MLSTLLAACGFDRRAGEIACQERMAGIAGGRHADRQKARPGPDGALQRVGDDFEAMSAAFAAMPLEGCSEDQLQLASSLTSQSRRLSDAFAKARRAYKSPDKLAGQSAIMEFAVEMEGFEKRRRALRQDLEKLKSGDRRGP